MRLIRTLSASLTLAVTPAAFAVPTDASTASYTNLAISDSTTNTYTFEEDTDTLANTLISSVEVDSSAIAFASVPASTASASVTAQRDPKEESGFLPPFNDYGFAYGRALDFLVFDRDTTVSYSQYVSSAMHLASDQDRAKAEAKIRIFDVTSFVGEIFHGRTVNAEVNPYEVHTTYTQIAFAGTSADLPTHLPSINERHVQVFPAESTNDWLVNTAVNDTLDVLAGHTYLFQVDAYADVLVETDGEWASASIVSKFKFTDLGGSRVESLSGDFGGSATTVPLPSTFLLFGLGFTSLALRQLGKRQLRNDFNALHEIKDL